MRTKPSFRDAFQAQRCVLPASGFYEWKRTAAVKKPYYIHPREEWALIMAGLWARYEKAGPEPIETCAVITTSPNEVTAPIHDRMPVLLALEDLPTWLHGSSAQLLRPCPAAWLTAHAVSTRVNSPRNDKRNLLESI